MAAVVSLLKIWKLGAEQILDLPIKDSAVKVGSELFKLTDVNSAYHCLYKAV